MNVKVILQRIHIFLFDAKFSIYFTKDKEMFDTTVTLLNAAKIYITVKIFEYLEQKCYKTKLSTKHTAQRNIV